MSKDGKIEDKLEGIDIELLEPKVFSSKRRTYMMRIAYKETITSCFFYTINTLTHKCNAICKFLIKIIMFVCVYVKDRLPYSPYLSLCN